MEDIQEVLRTLEKEEIRIDQKNYQLNEWKLRREHVQLVHASRLDPLAIIRPGQIDHPLVATNIERWRSETNIFHFNIHIGEMTPTLFYVYEILELAVDGDLVTCRLIKDLQKFIEDNLGIVPDGNLTNLKHTWLKVNFRELPPDATLVQFYRYTQAYLLFLISVTIFANASVSTVPTRQSKPAIWSKTRQFGAKQGIPTNPLVVSKRVSKQVGQRVWRNVNADKIPNWLFRHDCIMPDIQQDTDNGLPSNEYKAWYNLVSHHLIHNVANSPKDILQPHIHEEEEMDPTHEP
ncbi:hypothetical protein AMTR_s00066p00173450 [Amborella trichopoda]|uniref:Aminotransferase-like plant mobile domain-containing protein n=1 Tax=Amborella trichopoda TaxID=13333 RepID=U5D3U6_AMBTC|nr:hypothetical protein AMTR_s00066p00173450 [Amborella trichopoda]